MKISQISVFLENRAGRLSEVLYLLAGAEINILGLSLADTSDFGILRLIAREREEAIKILMKNGFTVGVTDVIAVALPHRPGSLDGILRLAAQGGINVEYMYALPSQANGDAVMIFRFDMTDRALQLFSENSIPMLDETDL